MIIILKLQNWYMRSKFYFGFYFSFLKMLLTTHVVPWSHSSMYKYMYPQVGCDERYNSHIMVSVYSDVPVTSNIEPALRANNKESCNDPK